MEATTAPGESGLARGWRRTTQLVEHGVTEFFRDGCSQRAASIGFYALFSLFPLAILMVVGFGLVVNDENARRKVIEFLLDNLPLEQDRGRRDLQRLLTQVTSRGAGFGVLGLMTLLWSASGVMGSIRNALNAAFKVTDPRPPAIAKAWDFLAVLGIGLLILASFALTVADEVTGLPLGQLFPLVVGFVVFAILFRMVPATCPRLRDTWPGVLVAAIGLELAKRGFALYLSHFADYGAVYASLGSVIAFLVFVYVAATVALLGAEFASEWPRVRSGAYDGGPPSPIGPRILGLLRSLFVRQTRENPDARDPSRK